MYARLRRQDFHDPSALGFMHSGSHFEETFTGFAQHKIVVVSTRIACHERHAGTDGGRGSKVERCPLDTADLPCGNKGVIDWGVEISHQLKLMVQDGAAAFTGEVPVGVIGEVQHRIGIGVSPIVDRQLVFFS